MITDVQVSGRDTFYWGMMQGTSMSCPAVTGIVALWLEAYPELTYAQVKELMRTTAITDSLITFEVAARFYSQDFATRTNGGQMADPGTGSAYFEIDQLKPQDYSAVKDLQPGQISEPVESLDNEGRNGNLVYKILRLDSIVPSHTASFEHDYTELQNDVRQAKQIKAIDDFISEKIQVTYIKIDPLFQDCEFELPGWKSKFVKD